MLYNKELDKIQRRVDCLKCPYFDLPMKKCNGYGKRCFNYDEKTHKYIDPKTKKQFNIKGEK